MFIACLLPIFRVNKEASMFLQVFFHNWQHYRGAQIVPLVCLDVINETYAVWMLPLFFYKGLVGERKRYTDSFTACLYTILVSPRTFVVMISRKRKSPWANCWTYDTVCPTMRCSHLQDSVISWFMHYSHEHQFGANCEWAEFSQFKKRGEREKTLFAFKSLRLMWQTLWLLLKKKINYMFILP